MRGIRTGGARPIKLPQADNEKEHATHVNRGLFANSFAKLNEANVARWLLVGTGYGSP
jgi:hypothetical protein